MGLGDQRAGDSWLGWMDGLVRGGARGRGQEERREPSHLATERRQSGINTLWVMFLWSRL